MLMIPEPDFVACTVVGLTSLVAVLALWIRPGAWWASITVLASGAVVVLLAPFKLAFDLASADLPGCGFPGELLVAAGFVVVLHLLAFGTVALLAGETIIERRRAEFGQRRDNDEVSGNDRS